MPFHVTARLQGRSAWFSGIERAIAQRISAASRRSDAALLAYAVMPNHLHLVVLQGRQPLSEVMQPLLRRIALLVQRRTAREGHIFERRFRAFPCVDPDYFRNAIAYVHLNGVRARLCATAEDYEWCSHAAYLRPGDPPDGRHDILVENALRVFAAREGDPLHECRANYLRFLEWRRAMDAYAAEDEDGPSTNGPPSPPDTRGGDAYWAVNYSSARAHHGRDRPKADLLDIARGTLLEIAPDMDLDLLRSGYRTKAIVAVRRRFILRAVAAGHGGGGIARFLNVAPSTVSSVRTAAMHEGRCAPVDTACAQRP